MNPESKSSASPHPRGRLSLRRGALIGGTLVLATGLLVAANATRKDETTTPPPRILPVATAELVLQESYEVESRFVGSVEAARTSRLGFEFAGTLERLDVEEGDRIEEGQLLAEMDTSILEAQKTELEAALTEAVANRDLGRSTYDRTARAVKSGAVSKQRLDEARQQYDTAAAAASRIEAQLESIAVSFTKSVLRAPYDGVVVERMADEGSVLTPGTPVLRVLEAEQLEIRAGLTPAAAQNLEIGTEVALRDRSGHDITATVSRILPERSETTRTVDVILTTEGSTPTLRDGDLVEVLLQREVAQEGVWLPRRALTESVRGLWAAYALQPTEDPKIFTVERRQLEVLHQDGERVFVNGAVASGDEIVIGGLHRIVPGQRVKRGGEMAATVR